MITRLEIIKRQIFDVQNGRGRWGGEEGLIVPGEVPNSANRLMVTFKENRIRGTRYPVDYYREVFLSS